ncbi:phage tail protein [Kribbella sp. CA-247076]|uniref:phage tail protein n=1 Tax=Kribbella sp. CA-247076 TaxID=3239941 RepID=UPI003D8B9B7E
MSVQQVELVQAFRFTIELTRSRPGRTLAAPPQLDAKASAGSAAAPPAPAGGGSRTGSTAQPTAGSTPAGDRLGDGGFQECTGLTLDADLRDVLEGGSNDATVRRLGRVKHAPIVLKRGMFVPVSGGYADVAIWNWIRAMVSGEVPLPRYDGSIQVFNPSFTQVVAKWTFVRALPVKVVGPSLQALTGAVAVEELHLAHEGLRLEVAP